MKETKYHIVEWAYACPYCGNEQGWTNIIDEDDFRDTHKCDECKQEFKLTR